MTNTSTHISKILTAARPLFAVALGLMAGLVVAFFAGENPFHVLSILFRSAFGSLYDFGMSLFYATPLMFTGLSVAVAFRAGLFNVGAEGQLVFGALAAATMGALFPTLPWPLAPLVATLAAFAAGAAWGAIPGWLLARRGSHEVITTIMLNFVAAGLANWFTINVLPNPQSQIPQTAPIGEGFKLHQFEMFLQAPVSSAIFVALLSALLVNIMMWKTAFGYNLRAVGQNAEAAKVSGGINTASIKIKSLTLAGGLAGLVGVSEVLGNAHSFKLDFSPGYGFIGIAVALLARSRPFGIIASALLFGALHKGTADLDFETEKITRDLSQILQALVILFVAAEGIWDKFNAWTRNLANPTSKGAP